ncbi:hypothetical protein ACFOWU_09565 [Epilithonimonas zeae]|uniref:Uncharacterized protein n=1 Tax=Epilithonimonas zeae TaxID=1416779 RepID=A0A1N6GQY0_9FLAO|nr:hypothetical protein [Epilithonimonas zeae]SIO09939.1 hypothetical protein SAMN05444409_1996 [Epilithonimonas zeae]
MIDNKSSEIIRLIKTLETENITGLEVVDFWDSDITAIGLRFDEKLLYISSYNYFDTKNYNVIIENFDTGEIIEPEKDVDFYGVIAKIKELSK